LGFECRAYPWDHTKIVKYNTENLQGVIQLLL